MPVYEWNCGRCGYRASGKDEGRVAARAIAHAQRKDHGPMLYTGMGQIHEFNDANAEVSD